MSSHIGLIHPTQQPYNILGIKKAHLLLWLKAIPILIMDLLLIFRVIIIILMNTSFAILSQTLKLVCRFNFLNQS